MSTHSRLVSGYGFSIRAGAGLTLFTRLNSDALVYRSGLATMSAVTSSVDKDEPS